MARVMSRSDDLADTTITLGGCASRGSASSTPQPSITGIITSRSIRSKRSSAIRLSAVSPSAARAVSKPSASRLTRSISRMSGSSSTMRTRVTSVFKPHDASPPGDLSDADGVVAALAQHVDGLEHLARRHGHDHADAEVEHAGHLVVLDPAHPLDLGEHPRLLPRLRVDHG